MPKVNPWSLKRPPVRFETRTFTDSAYPGVEFTFHLRPLAGTELVLVGERSSAEVDRWITQQLPWPCEGPPPRLSAGVITIACMAEAMQQDEHGQPHDPENFYSFADLIGLADRTREAWVALMHWVERVSAGAFEELQGNEPRADGNS